MNKFFSFCFAVVVALQLSAQSTPNKVATSQKFEEVLMYINKMYVDTVNDIQLTEAAIVGMLEKLDPHSTYISKEEVDEANQSINGSFVGIGIRFQILKDTLMVIATIPGGPSEKLGIQPGDKITKIENINIAGIGLKNNQVREKLMGELGSKVRVEIQRRSMKKPLDFIIMRDNIPINSVDSYYMLTPEIGYIKLNSFSRTTMEEVARALKELKGQGMKDLIFDLQDNGGGLLYAAQQLADEFLSGEKLVVYSEGRAQPRSDLKAGKKGLWEDGRVVVLTDEYSASASEILSGAIQDWDRGVIVGRRTYGKGLVQRPIDLTDGSQMRLTIARYYTPSGRWIQKPYDDAENYKNDIANRLEHGELSNSDSIKFPDSLKYYTLVNKRLVYGGGGIMPDVFVGIDTSGITDYYRDLVQKGHVNSFLLDYIDRNRDEILAKYPNFDAFNNTFYADKKLLDEFFKYVEKEDKELKFNQEQYNTSEKLLLTRMKAIIAQNIWGFSESYQITNKDNNIVQRAVKVLEGNEYDQLLKK
ncbi:MAG: S41 family peptidase [Bacteroidota bacterium]